MSLREGEAKVIGREGGIEGREETKDKIKEEREKESLGRKFRLSLRSKGEEVIHGRTLRHKNTIRDRQGTRKNRFFLGREGPTMRLEELF